MVIVGEEPSAVQGTWFDSRRRAVTRKGLTALGCKQPESLVRCSLCCAAGTIIQSTDAVSRGTTTYRRPSRRWKRRRLRCNFSPDIRIGQLTRCMASDIPRPPRTKLFRVRHRRRSLTPHALRRAAVENLENIKASNSAHQPLPSGGEGSYPYLCSSLSDIHNVSA